MIGSVKSGKSMTPEVPRLVRGLSAGVKEVIGVERLDRGLDAYRLKRNDGLGDAAHAAARAGAATTRGTHHGDRERRVRFNFEGDLGYRWLRPPGRSEQPIARLAKSGEIAGSSKGLLQAMPTWARGTIARPI